MTRRIRKARGFSLVELVIVIVIIGVIAAIAVPRLSRGAKGARDSALRGNLAVLRNAIDLYSAEHAGKFPTVGGFVAELTTYSDEGGTTGPALDGATGKIYGPYLKAVPGLPIAGVGTTGGKVGDTTVAAADGLGVGWIYTALTGDIVANTGTAKDEKTTLYSDY
ncbi:MAG: type II secretion system protein [Phycisphaerae bacterium]